MKKVLIVEDDLMMADMLEDVLQQAGFAVQGIARSPQQAKQLAEQQQPDLAVVDVYLLDGNGTDVARDLIARFGTGILYTTGNVDSLINASGHAYFSKPFRLGDTASALQIVLELVEHGRVTSPVPAGLHLLNYPAPGA